MSIGLRSGSYGSLQQIQNSILPIQTTPPLSSRKASKVLKEKDKLFHWICKFAGRKKVGMLLLCTISAAVFMWVLYVGKGEETQEVDRIESIRRNDSLNYSHLENSSPHGEQDDVKLNVVQNVGGGSGSGSFAMPPPLFSSANGEQEDIKISASQYVNGGSGRFAPPPPLFSSAYGEQEDVKISASQYVNGGSESLALPPPSPEYFTGYTLPPGNPCETFTLPPPPADKKRTGPRPCPVCYLPVEEAIALMPRFPSFSPVLKQLTYIHEENLTKSEFGGSEFGGYPSLRQRNDSYDIRESMSVHCGFVRGNKPGRHTGFDIDDPDLLEMEQCRGVVVASAIFGAYDLVQQPNNISEAAKKNVCFFMFVDEETDAFMRNSGELDSSKRLGLWRVVVVYNLPYTDPRRNGKVPKLLLHRLFPNARYSLWIDGKLQLVVDPYQILERFLWRKNASFAISRHYKRFDAFVEAEANKAAGKYDNASIDFQINFYKNEGLTPYSEAKLPITSDVPEGCVIVREHVPISNLFGCLWFHEVDRFTSRDQISFSIVRDKIMSKTNWSVNMFLDCERRNFVVQGYHRDVLENWAPPPPPGAIAVAPPPPFLNETPNIPLPHILTQSFISIPTKKVQGKRGSRRSSSRRHRKVASGSKDIN